MSTATLSAATGQFPVGDRVAALKARIASRREASHDNFTAALEGMDRQFHLPEPEVSAKATVPNLNAAAMQQLQAIKAGGINLQVADVTPQSMAFGGAKEQGLKVQTPA